MATYITLGRFTEQGMRGIRETTSRADAVREQAKKAGLDMKAIYWTQGKYDMVVFQEGSIELDRYPVRSFPDPYILCEIACVVIERLDPLGDKRR